MILPVKDVLVRAWQRGYGPKSILGCLSVPLSGGLYDVDPEHSAYPKTPIGPKLTKTLREYLELAQRELGVELPTVSAPQPAGGPGTELKKLLAFIGITATGDCKCNQRAAYMDRLEAAEPGWCERNVETVVGWLRESAHERGLPFLDAAGRMLIRRAIKNARKAAS